MKGLPASMVRVGTPDAVMKEPVKLSLGDDGVSEKLAVKLPPLLEARRREFAIPDCCFTRVAMFDRCLIFQITEGAQKASPGSMLWAPETAQARNLKDAPRGVVITAGLAALDYLWANGVRPGNIVNFVRLSPWRMPVGTVKGTEIQLHVVRAGDIVAHEDQAIEAEVVLDEDKGLHQLQIDGKVRPRADVQPSDDY